MNNRASHLLKEINYHYSLKKNLNNFFHERDLNRCMFPLITQISTFTYFDKKQAAYLKVNSYLQIKIQFVFSYKKVRHKSLVI